MLKEATKVKRWVQWDEEEYQRLAEQVWNMRAKNPAKNLTVLVNAAVKQWPEDRRRTIQSATTLPRLLELLRKMDTAYRDQAAKAEQLEMKIQNCQSESHQAVNDHELLTRYRDRFLSLLTPDDLARHYPATSLLASVETTDLVAEAARRLTEGLLAGRLPTPKPEPAKIVVINRTKKPALPKPKIGVLGPLPGQMNEIQRKINGTADAIFLDKDRSKPVGSGANGLDGVVLWANFISHSLSESIKANLGGHVPVKVARGGVGAVVEMIRALAADFVPSEAPA